MKKSKNPGNLLERKVPLKSPVVLSFVSLAVIAGIVAIVFAFAAGPFASVEPESGTLSGGATELSVAGASGGKVVRFGNGATPTPTPTATPSGVPDVPSQGWLINTTNTGLARLGLSCDSLPVYSGPSKPAAGTTIYRKKITVPMDLYNGNITIDQSCLKPSTLGSHHNFIATTTLCPPGDENCYASPTGNVVIKDSEIDAEHFDVGSIAETCAFLGVGTVLRTYAHGMGSGICFFETGTVHNALAQGNYVRGLRACCTSHNEAATVRDFRKNANDTRTAKFIGNRLDFTFPINATGALFLQPTWVSIYNVTVQDNYLEGDGYNLYLENAGGTYGNMRAINNRFRPTSYGASAVASGPGWAEWRDNYRYDATKVDGKGAVVSP